MIIADDDKNNCGNYITRRVDDDRAGDNFLVMIIDFADHDGDNSAAAVGENH